MQLLGEATTLQSRLRKIGMMKNTNVVSRKFNEYISNRNVNSAIKLPSNNMKGRALRLNKESIALLKVKYPVGKAASEETKLRGLLPTIKNIIVDVINDSMFLDHQRWVQMAGDKSWYQETLVM